MNEAATSLAFPDLADELERIRTSIEAAIRESIASVHEVGFGVLASQVSMERSGLVLEAARAMAGQVPPEALALGEIVELIHYASLLHEKGTALTPKESILLGDLFLARAMTLLAAQGSGEYVSLVAAITSALAEGQILELELERADPPPSSPEVFESLFHQVASLRTGCVFANAAVMGGIAGGMPDDAREALAEFGNQAGLVHKAVKLLEEDGFPEGLDRDLLRRIFLNRTADDLRGARVSLSLAARAAGDRDLSGLEAWLDRIQDRITELAGTMGVEAQA